MRKHTRQEEKLLGPSGVEGVNYLLPQRLTTRLFADTGDIPGGKYQITYSFSSAIRKNLFRTHTGKKRAYGRPGVSFRLLYDFLCKNFNGGEYFIDNYFKDIFKSRSVYERFVGLNDTVMEDMRNEYAEIYDRLPRRKDGLPDRRYAITKEYVKSLKTWSKASLRNTASRIAEEVRRDIKACLSTGQMPLKKQAVSEATMRERAKFSIMNRTQFFLASGQLIDNLRIYVAIRGDE